MRWVVPLLVLLICGCAGKQNSDRPLPPRGHGGEFFKLEDGVSVFYHVREPLSQPKTTIYVFSGIVGINHNRKDDLITRLYDDSHRVITIHPRGTGYSQGVRGGSPHFEDFIEDYVQIISDLSDLKSEKEKVILYGEGVATATVLAVAAALKKIDGIILVDPSYKSKRLEAESWTIWDHTRYAAYSIFARHTPVVDLGGNPERIRSPRKRVEIRSNLEDPLFVRYFSTYYVQQSKKLVGRMDEFAKKANAPLLMLYGEGNPYATQKGCGEIFSEWAHPNRIYRVIPDRADRQSTASSGAGIIRRWIRSVGKEKF